MFLLNQSVADARGGAFDSHRPLHLRLPGSQRKSRLVEGGFFVPCARSSGAPLRVTASRPNRVLLSHR